MKLPVSILLLLTLCCLPSIAQRKTYLGVESAIANDLYRITDSGNELRSIPLYNATVGLQIRQEVTQLIFIETGKGTFWSAGLAVRYSISDLWNRE